jgi:hypothetical protein
MKSYVKGSGTRARGITISTSADAVTVTRSWPWKPGGTFPVDDPEGVARDMAADLEEDGFVEEGP